MFYIHSFGAIWHKSTRSSANSQCVEVATLGSGTAVRDSKDPTGPILTVTSAGWAAFTAAIRAGDFD
jgi:hypothetical protein